jgi:Glycosyltransferase family 25 (LPS biosynthesis protein)
VGGASGHHGYQNACDLVTGQASTQPLGPRAFARAGEAGARTRRIIHCGAARSLAAAPQPAQSELSLTMSEILVAERSTYRGLFINLDRSADRRERMQAQLEKFNLQDRYSRFPAVDARTLTKTGSISVGEYACFQSHYLALEKAKSAHATVHILEDDVELVPQLEIFVSSLEARGAFDRFDIIFTDVGVPYEVWLLRKYKKLFETFLAGQPPKLTVLDFNKDYRWGFQSYLVPARSLDNVLSVLRRGLYAGPDMPIDIFVRQAARAGRLRLGCIFPFITTIQISDVGRTTITDRGEETELSREIVSLLSYSFFVGRNLGNLPASLLEKLHAHDDDGHGRLLTAVLGFIICSNEFSGF